MLFEYSDDSNGVNHKPYRTYSYERYHKWVPNISYFFFSLVFVDIVFMKIIDGLIFSEINDTNESNPSGNHKTCQNNDCPFDVRESLASLKHSFNLSLYR
jgi:hypothetical protein